MKGIITSILFISMILGIQAQNWLTNIEMAKKEAEKTNRNIIMVFQGSDWCAPCMKLDKEIWSTEEFKSFAENNFVMFQVDFPRKRQNKLTKEQKEHNGKLFEKYNTRGAFPFVAVIDSNGKLLGTSGYKKMEVKAYIQELMSF